MTDLELSISNLSADEVGDLWQRLSLVAEGFLRDGREVTLTTYRHDEFDDADLTPDPSEETQS